METIATSLERGRIPIYHLKRYWSKNITIRQSKSEKWPSERTLDKALLDCLGLGLEPTIQYLYQRTPSFTQFEDWITTQTNLDSRIVWISRFNQLFDEKQAILPNDFHYLSSEDLRFFSENGYIIIKQAISKEACEETIHLITNHLHVDLQNPDTWYQSQISRQGIMVQLFRHELLEQNRHSPKIRQAYECLWKNQNLWVSTDRVGFNPPETDTWKFPGPHLHLDIEPEIPLPFGLQGILYLTDTAANQGAFTLIPGFHKQINHWMEQFGKQQVPLGGVFDEFDSRPIAAEAGDFIIWHHGLPHGSRPNTNTKPRIVQYINWYPVR